MNNKEHLTNTHEVGNGRISVTSNDYGHGTYTTMCDHGATTSGVAYIAVHASGHASIHWNDTHYHYRGGDALAIVSYFAATLSMGKTANFIKATGEVVARAAA
tara:strand:+ start:179 stop:487 length:309 start_codon:yes stop_codon:yes gene_type:complete